MKISSFKDLVAWQKAHTLAVMVYEATKDFPQDEKFGLISQLKRAVVSITSNIAEGFSRRSLKEKVNFYSIALGSLTETESQLLLAKDLGYLKALEIKEFEKQAILVNKLCNGLIKSSHKLTT